jgi:cell filamentation protein
LANKLGIEDPIELRDREADLALRQEVYLTRVRFHRSYDFDHLRFLHQRLFGDVYDWAGNVRTVPINKDGSEFARPEHISSEAARIFGELRKENILQATTMSDLPPRLAYFFGELNALHPFREGNGRTQRLFISHILELRSLILEWSRVTPQQMVSVSVAVHHGNDAPLRSLFAEIIRPL